MVNFIKVLEYDLKPDSLQVFEYLSSITNQTYDPPSLRTGELILDAQKVFYSPLRRSAECIKTVSGVIYESKTHLKEIPFVLSELCSKEEWFNYRSNLVRKRFKEFLIEDKLPIPSNVIWSEIHDLVLLIRDANRDCDNVAVVSHSFRMKLIEAYIKTNGKIVSEQNLIHDYIKDDQKTYNFGEGFCVDMI